MRPLQPRLNARGWPDGLTGGWPKQAQQQDVLCAATGQTSLVKYGADQAASFGRPFFCGFIWPHKESPSSRGGETLQ